MLAPDKDTAIAGLAGLVQQNARALLWARLVSTTVLPPLDKPPAWYGEVRDRLGSAAADAQKWLTAGGPRLFAEAAQANVDYGRTFAEVAVELEKAVGPARAARRALTAGEKEDALALVEALREAARESRARIKAQAQALDDFRKAMVKRQGELSHFRAMVDRSRGTISAAIQSVEQEVIRLRQVLAANEVKYDESQTSFASGVAGILYAVTVAPVLAAGTLSAGVALSVAMLGMTIWKLESYTQVLRENSGKLNTVLSKVAADDYEVLLLGGIIDTISTLDHAAERADGMLATLSATWDQTVSDLDSLVRTLALPEVGMDRLPQLQTMKTASATWAAIVKVAATVQDLRFESTTILCKPGA
ncbi:MAG TPA: hypothetical protein VEA60_06610 [Allosphingosinicella sp.]|nr:hypothetical protein [Allosphingosinicella sp.]